MRVSVSNIYLIKKSCIWNLVFTYFSIEFGHINYQNCLSLKILTNVKSITTTVWIRNGVTTQLDHTHAFDCRVAELATH